ncbi:MAG: cytochrome P460 family protein [Gemmatimonadota bacterium]
MRDGSAGLRLAGAAVLATAVLTVVVGAAGFEAGPTYDGEGNLNLPHDLYEWILVGSSIGLGYNEDAPQTAAGEAPGFFHNVLMEPSSYSHYAETGDFKEGTMLALMMYEPGVQAAPRENGFYEERFVAMEIAVKDAERFEDGWGYTNFVIEDEVPSATGEAMPPGNGCFECHAEHAGNDNVFVQFYPAIRRLDREREQ